MSPDMPIRGTGSRSAPPRASAMIEALRGLGYTTETAIADLIDNSISAKAHTVHVQFFWDGPDSWISISDDGHGMTDSDLERAMRLGDKNPLDSRDPSDLGRFGLGLKTASFSQARRLTVLSRKDSDVSCLRWDLDFLANDKGGGWLLLEGANDAESEARLQLVAGSVRGTVVLWEVLDRIVSSSFNEQDFLDLIDRVERHLSMVFHRYIGGPAASVALAINGKALEPWDPFLAGHPATAKWPEVSIGEGVVAQGFTLPHKDRLTEREFTAAGGPSGWASHQGFYVYRGRRLLVAGSWLGLGRGRSWHQDEAHRLARIRLDVPSSADSEWKVDVKKSTAHPPASLRESLTRFAEHSRDRARRVFLHRAQANSALTRADDLVSVWTSTQTKTGRRYRVDREHPAVKLLLGNHESAAAFEAVLRVLEETIPVQRIWLETTETGDAAGGSFTSEPDDAVRAVLLSIYTSLVQGRGIAPADARRQLLRTEPFDLHPALVAALPDVILE